jgi:hypothetical protein
MSCWAERRAERREERVDSWVCRPARAARTSEGVEASRRAEEGVEEEEDGLCDRGVGRVMVAVVGVRRVVLMLMRRLLPLVVLLGGILGAPLERAGGDIEIAGGA